MALLLGILTGFVLPIQNGINARLRRAVVSPFLMSLVSFSVGLVFLVVLTLSVERSLLFPASMVAELPVWSWLGGPFGVAAMTTTVLLLPKIGAVQTAIIPLSGQILMGLLIDQFGWFGVSQLSMTWVRALGAVLMLLGVLAVVLAGNQSARRAQQRAGSARAEASVQDPALWFWRAAGVGAGALFASQAAVNGHLGTEIGSSLKAAMVSFGTGALVLVLIVVVTRPRLQLIRENGQRVPWWIWFGGILGSGYVVGNAYLVPVLGAGATTVAVLLGMMAGSLLVDHFGLLSVQRKPVVLPQVVALVVMALGVVLVRMS